MIQNAAQKTVSFETPKLAGAAAPGCWAHAAAGLNKAPTRANAGQIRIFIGNPPQHIFHCLGERHSLPGLDTSVKPEHSRFLPDSCCLPTGNRRGRFFSNHFAPVKHKEERPCSTCSEPRRTTKEGCAR